MVDVSKEHEGLAWQIGVWNTISEIYVSQIDRRFRPVTGSVIDRAALLVGESVLDLGTGTGAVAEQAAVAVGPSGRVIALDISPRVRETATAA